jgi:biotin operon repressor
MSAQNQQISHRNLEKSFVDAIKKEIPSIKIGSKVKPDQVYRPDIILQRDGEKIFIEVKSSRYPSEIIRTIYQIIGYFTLASEKYNSAYVVIPKKAFSPQVKQLLYRANEKLRKKLGVIAYSVKNNKLTFEVVISPLMHIFPTLFSTKLPSLRLYPRKKISLSSPKALRVLKHLLIQSETTQFEISNKTKVSIGHVNKIINYLREQGITIYRGRKLILAEPWKLLNEISWSRSMHSLRTEDLSLPSRYSSVEEVETLLRDICKENRVQYAFTLFSAARRYSSYIKKYDVVQLYIDNYEQAKQFFPNDFFKKGDGVHLEIYQPDSEDILTESRKIGNFKICSETQTIIDLICYGDIGRELAIEIYTNLRGKRIEPSR